MFYKQIYNNDRVMITKEQFENLADKELTEKDGKLVYNGNLDLRGTKDIRELPDNLKVLGWLNLRCSDVIKLPKGLEVEGSLDISWTDVEELPEDTKFGGSLGVSNMNMNRPFFFPKVLKVDGDFVCRNTLIKRMPEELYVKNNCYFSCSRFDKLPKVMEFGDDLSLYNTHITELPEGIKEVYGVLNIDRTYITELPDNFVAHSYINIDNTPIKELPKGFIIGHKLYLDDAKLKDCSNLHKVCSEFRVSKEKYYEIKDTLAKYYIEYFDDVADIVFEPNYKGAYLFENENGRYIKSDNIFGKIVEQKGNVYHIKTYYSDSIIYLVTDGLGRWSHGKTLEEAKDDLLYKISKRKKSNYKNLSLDSELSFEEAIVCYRVITGACSFGTRDFIENRLGENKKEVYTIKEIIKITKGEYGDRIFRSFFL